MTDPATTASAKAIGRIGNGLMNVSLRYAAEVGADEALKPIRDWHQKQSQRLSDKCSPEALMLKSQLDDLAPLIYVTEELER